MTKANAIINVRIDGATKRAADHALREMGLDLSTGIKVFLRQVVRSGSLPFHVGTMMLRDAGRKTKASKKLRNY